MSPLSTCSDILRVVAYRGKLGAETLPSLPTRRAQTSPSLPSASALYLLPSSPSVCTIALQPLYRLLEWTRLRRSRAPASSRVRGATPGAQQRLLPPSALELAPAIHGIVAVKCPVEGVARMRKSCSRPPLDQPLLPPRTTAATPARAAATRRLMSDEEPVVSLLEARSVSEADLFTCSTNAATAIADAPSPHLRPRQTTPAPFSSVLSSSSYYCYSDLVATRPIRRCLIRRARGTIPTLRRVRAAEAEGQEEVRRRAVGVSRRVLRALGALLRMQEER